MNTYSFCMLLIFSIFEISIATSNILKQFTVQPGGKEYSVSNTRDGVTCTFTYQCQGGTNEKWVMVMTQIKEKGTYGCVIEREDNRMSYIFFQKFKLHVDGNAEFHGAELFHKGQLSSKEYVADKKTKSVINSKHFNSQMSKAAVQYSLLDPSKKQEL